MSTNLYAAHQQWRDRPADERFWNLTDLNRTLTDVRDRGRERDTYARSIRAVAVDEPGYDSPDLRITGRVGGTSIRLTHWSMGQLARYSGAPADYLRSIPAPLAAECINHGLAKRGDDAASILLHRDDGDGMTLRSLTSDHYSRLWNADLVNALAPAIDNGWMVPPARPVRDDPRARPATAADIVPGQDAFGLAVKEGDLIAPAGVYASDHDLFVFLVNPTRVIDVDGSGGLMRGVFLYNSEVGAGAFRVTTFLLEAVCGNHIVWSASDVRTYRRVHRGNVFSDLDGFAGQMSRQLTDYADRDTTAERNMVEAARRYVLGKDREETVKNLAGMKQLGLSQTVIDAAYTVAEEYEHTAKAPPNTAWSMSHALTRYSQTTPFADERSRLDSAAGKLLALVSN